LNYPQFITWAELYQPKPPGNAQQRQQQICCILQTQQQAQLLPSSRV
jgi:hypothetical protein